MKRTNRIHRRIRAAALLLLLSMVITLVPRPAMAEGGASSAASSSSSANYTEITFVKWHRMIAKENYNPYPPDMKGKYPVLVMWKDNGTYYVANENLSRRYYTGWFGDWWRAAGSTVWEGDGRKGYVPRPFDEDTWNVDTFYTTGDVSTWKVQFTGKRDGDNGGNPIVYFWMNDKDMLDAESHWHTASAGTTGNIVENTIELGPVLKLRWEYVLTPTSLIIGMVNEWLTWKTPRSYVRIFHNENNDIDTWFSYYGDRVWGDKSYYSLSNLDFVVYWGEEERFTALDSTIVPKGAVLNVDDGMFLKDGCTLNISPGATVVVEGKFFNNGTIENHGTLVLKDGACISTFMPKFEGAGTIICDGSEVDELEMVQKSIADAERKLEDLNENLRDAYEYRNDVSRSEGLLRDAFDDYVDSNPEQMKLIEEAGAVKTAASNALNAVIAQIEETKTEIADLEEALGDLKEQLKNDRDTLTEAQIAKRENEITKLEAQIKTLNSTLTKLDTDRVKANTAYEDASAKYAEVAAEYEEYEKRLAEASERYFLRDGEVKEAERLYQEMERNVQDMKDLAERIRNQGGGTVKAGEGNLVIMPGARVFQDEGSRLEITNGGSVVCGGLLLTPGTKNPITVSNAKLEVPDGGILLTGYKMTQNLSSLSELSINNPETISTLAIGANNNMSGIGGYSNKPVIVDGDSYVEIDGFWKEFNRTGLTVSSGISDGQAYVANSGTWILTGSDQ